MRTVFITGAAIAVMSVASAAFADPPPWAGGGKGKGHSESKGKGWGKGKGHAREERPAHSTVFVDEHRVVVREYYDTQFQRGHCPPGLAKKRNGCMPPGQAKKWQLGRPLPREIVYYDVPPPLIARLPPPPAGHKYVRVAADILLIAVGTAMVVDAIQDLGRG